MSQENKLDPRTRRIVAAGRLLFGERWQSPLARVMGVSQSILTKAADGTRPPTEATMAALDAALDREAARLRATADKIDRLRQRR
jgi:hypothetical protein